jgi:anaerobic magnesium-protoporphyrin IX monomethyl ester cyclase
MDAIIIADTGSESVSATTQFRFQIDGHTANIQTVENFLDNHGHVIPPINYEGIYSWQSSLKLNGIYLYSYLSNRGLEVCLIDSYFREKSKFISMLKQSPKAVVISTTFIMSKKTLNALVRDIRAVAPDIFIIAGGQFVHLSARIRDNLNSNNGIQDQLKDEYLFLDGKDEPQVDLYIISSSGEMILAEALKLLKRGRKPDGLPNTADYVGKGSSTNNKEEVVVKTGGVTVDWKKMPNEFFASGVVPLQASYGCPFHCAFCNFMKDRRLMGVKPIDNLIEELKIVQEKGVKYVWFVDDNFRLGKNDLEIVCRKMIDNGIQLKWKSFIRPSAMRDLDIAILKAAGCLEVQFGLESADPLILKRMSKKSNPKLYANVIERALDADINCSCYFIFGFPGETQDTVKRTLEFIKGVEHPELAGSIYFSMFPFIIAPLSPISESGIATTFGLKGSMYQWEHDTMNYKEAIGHATKAFFELETSGINYPGDNLELLYGLNPRDKKVFIATRHKLAKASLRGELKEENKLHAIKKACGHFLPNVEGT